MTLFMFNLSSTESRRDFFDRWLSKLRREASQGYEALATACTELQPHLVCYPEVPLLKDISMLDNVKEDSHSKALLPGSCKHLIPLTTNGDGNCLYRYAMCDGKICCIVYYSTFLSQ